MCYWFLSVVAREHSEKTGWSLEWSQGVEEVH